MLLSHIISKASEIAGQHRDSVEVQLTRNLLTIALNNIGNPGAAALYFDQSIIARPSSGSDKDANLGNPQPGPVK